MRLFRERYPHARPIIVMTTATNTRVRSEEIGADGFLAKPFQLDRLVETVRRWA